jgi:hypothetical protein
MSESKDERVADNSQLQITIRPPHDLWRRFQAIAASEQRSGNGLIIHLITKTVAEAAPAGAQSKP